MVKEFPHHIAWTDAMREGCNYVGLIEYQRKLPCARVHVLWVFSPYEAGADEAEGAAINMLEQICEITDGDNVIYSDGVAL
jgi:hypothetical protein